MGGLDASHAGRAGLFRCLQHPNVDPFCVCRRDECDEGHSRAEIALPDSPTPQTDSGIWQCEMVSAKWRKGNKNGHLNTYSAHR